MDQPRTPQHPPFHRPALLAVPSKRRLWVQEAVFPRKQAQKVDIKTKAKAKSGMSSGLEGTAQRVSGVVVMKGTAW